MPQPKTLYEYYTGKGKKLPSVSERSTLFEQAGLGTSSEYRGTARQNVGLLGHLQEDGTGAPVGGTSPGAPAAPVAPPDSPLVSGLKSAATEAERPLRDLSRQTLAAQEAQRSPVDIYSEQYRQAGIPRLDEQIRSTQSVIDQINKELGRGILHERGKTIPMGLIRGRTQALREQKGQELSEQRAIMGQHQTQRGQAFDYAGKMSDLMQQAEERPAELAKSRYEAEKDIGQRGREEVFEARKEELQPDEPEYEYRTVGRDLVQIDKKTGVSKVVHQGRYAPTGGAGKEDDEEAEVKAAQEDIADMILKLEKGDINWAGAYDYIRALYPWMPNEAIDSALGGSIPFDRESGEWKPGEASGRAIAKEPKKK